MTMLTKEKNKKKLIAFGWYGGKFSHLDWLLPLLPETKHFCEPFGGSAAVLLNRNPAEVETYNDLDGDVANFFRMLRENKDKLIELIGLTPFSREEFEYAINNQYNEKISDIERARLFFIRARQVRTGLAQTASSGRWSNCTLTSRAGMSGAVSRWLGSIDNMPDIAQRLLRVQIENKPAIEVIKKYDSEDTLFYCDPPYQHDTRTDTNAYKFEMTNQDHIDLVNTLRSVKGKVALSGYDSELMNSLLHDWKKIIGPVKTAHSVRKPRQEILWVNYDIDVNENTLWDIMNKN
jgi:DNA adenine methylase